MKKNQSTQHTSTSMSPDSLFQTLAAEIKNHPNFTQIFMKDAARSLCSHYGIAHLQALIEQVPQVFEYWIENGLEYKQEVPKPEVISHVQQGCTLICNDMHQGDPQSAHWSSRLLQIIDKPGQSTARIFYTNAIEQAYGMHLDPFYTLTLQISGSKLWRIARRHEAIKLDQLNHSIMAPAPGVIETGPYGQIVGPDDRDDLFDEVILQAGDALLIAPAVWHHVRPLSESLSIALDVVPQCQAISPLEMALIRHSR